MLWGGGGGGGGGGAELINPLARAGLGKIIGSGMHSVMSDENEKSIS